LRRELGHLADRLLRGAACGGQPEPGTQSNRVGILTRPAGGKADSDHEVQITEKGREVARLEPVPPAAVEVIGRS